MVDNSEENQTPETPLSEEVTPEQAQWNETLQRLGLGEVDLLRFTTQDVLYLVKRMQFLQVVESTGTKEAFDEPQLITANSGWTIHYYGDAMCTSPGRFLYGGGYFRFSEDGDDEGGGIVNPGKGTIVKQSFDSACQIIQLAKEFGWGGVLIVDGHPDMQRAAWVEAVRIGVRLEGYEPNLEAEKKRRRIVSPSIERMKEVVSALRSSGV